MHSVKGPDQAVHIRKQEVRKGTEGKKCLEQMAKAGLRQSQSWLLPATAAMLWVAFSLYILPMTRKRFWCPTGRSGRLILGGRPTTYPGLRQPMPATALLKEQA